MLTRLPRAMDLPGTKSTSTGGESALCSFWGLRERSNWSVWLSVFWHDGRRGAQTRRGNISMNKKGDTSSIILVVEDVNETRDGIEKLLKADGYRITLARDERDAIESAQREPPNLILVSVAGLPHEVVIAARHIRDLAGLEANVPVVVFCIAAIDEGDELAIGQNVYITRPDNFNQLRTLLARLLNEIPIAA